MFSRVRWGGLRAKIIAWSFVPTAIILAAVALVGFYAYQQVTQDMTIESSREVARLSAGQLGAELSEYSDTLTALARTADIYGNDAARRRVALARASNRLVIFDGGVLLLDNYGTVVAAQPDRPEVLGQDWSNRTYYQKIVRLPGTIYSNVVHDGPAGAPVIVVAVPITSDQGELVGMLAGMFRVGASSVSPFYGSIVRLHIGASDSAYLVDGKGLVFYHTDDALIGQNWKTDPVVQQVLTAKADAVRTRDLGGRDVVASFAPVPGTPWGLVAEQSWDVLLSPGQRYFQFLFLLLLLGLLVPATVVMFGVRKITDPINRLIVATEKTASGNLGQTITVQTGDELEELGKQFNRMSGQLAASYDELKAREERYALVMQGTNDGIWDWDLKTDDVYFSARWKSMLGYDDRELPNRFETWRNLLHPDDAERALAALRDYLERRSPSYKIDVRMRHKDGSYRWISARGGALRGAHGKPYRMAGSQTDITERRQAEEKIRRQNEYLAALHDTALGVMSRLQVEDLLETTVERAVSLVDAADGFVYMVTPEGDALESTVETGPYRRYVGQRLRRGEGLAGQVWDTGQPIAVEDYQAWSGRSSRFEDTPIGPELGAPLKSGSEIVGVIGLTRAPGAQPFSPDEIELVSRFAQLASIALDNARLHTSLQSELEERSRAEQAVEERLTLEKLISDISTQFINLGPDEIDTGIQRALQSIAGFAHADRSFVFRFSEDGSTMNAAHGWCADGIEPQVVWREAVSTDRVPYCAQRLRKLAVFQVSRVAELPAEAHIEQAEFERQGVQSLICVPMVYRGVAVGFIRLDAVRAEQNWNGDVVTLLTFIGEIFVNALERKRYNDTERRRQLAEGLRDILSILNANQPLGETLNHIVAQARRLLGSDSIALFRLDPENETLRIQASDGLTPDYVANMIVPVGRGAVGRAVLQRTPVVVSEPTVPRAELDAFPISPAARPLLEPVVEQFKVLVGIPLVLKNQVYGAITLYYTTQREISEEETRLAVTFADQAALAIENAQLREQAERAAALGERSRLARELHDSVTQSLYSVTLYAEAAARLMTSGAHAQAAEHLRELRDTAQEALREMRLLIFELRPPALEKTGLAAALQARLDGVETRGGMKAELRVEGEEHLAPRVQEELYHIARETLNNALKHSNAHSVQVHLEFLDDSTRLEICDDGAGFESEEIQDSGGLGFKGMNERAQRIGGDLTIESAPGKGTRVRIKVPQVAGVLEAK